MKKIILVFLVQLGILTQVFANDFISQTLMKEWTTFRTQVNEITPDGDVGGYMLYREYGDMTLLWRTFEGEEENEVIRFFMQRKDGVVFAVTYHKSDIIVPGRIVLRRFVGTEPVGWINHTIDFNSLEYLGSQGFKPEITSQEKAMMKKWGIEFIY